MANYRTTQDLKKEVLLKCGETTDGTSSYDANALQYLVNANRAVISGGNEFEVDLSEPWSWAIARRPIVLTLQPPYTAGGVSFTNGSNIGTLDTPPSFSLVGWLINLESGEDFYAIRQHVAGAATFQIDQPFPLASIAGSQYQAIQIDYDLIDDDIVIDQSNYLLDFQESSTPLVAILSSGVYTPAAFAAHVQAQMIAAGSLAYAHSWDPVRRLFTWSAPSNFSLLFATGANVFYSPSLEMGMDVADKTSATSYQSAYALNAINRLCAPMQVYQSDTNDFLAAQDVGKVYEVDYNTYIRRQPLSQMVMGIPDRYAVTRAKDNGVLSVRFNAYVQQGTRVEVPYIPQPRDLQDAAASVPAVPLGFREALVFMASYFLLIDKSDNRSDSMATLAKNKLSSLLHHNRKELSLAGNNYAKLVPRAGGTRKKFITEIT